MSPEFDDVPMNVEPFNVETEFVADPLVPDGTFKGLITKVELKPENGILEFTVTLEGNEGIYCSDGVTPIDGKISRYALWLPRKGDELLKSKFTALTVRQDRIRAIKKFSNKMNIIIGNDQDILLAIERHEWISIPVLASIKSRPFGGVLYNQIKKMERATS